MRTRISKHVAIPGIALLALAPVMSAPAAYAAEDDISVVYTTQNYASAPIDGSYTVNSRVGQTRDDMSVTYTIVHEGVAYPMPVINYTGSFTDTDEATYTFRFGCDTEVAGSTCTTYQNKIDLMNSWAEQFDGNSISTFTTDVAPIIKEFGGEVPIGVTGTVTVSINSSVPGEGELEFYLYERDTDEQLSPTAITPLKVTEPEITAEGQSPFCEAGLEAYTEGDTTYTPTNYGRDTDPVSASILDEGILPDDVNPVGINEAGLTFTVTAEGADTSDSGLSLAEVNEQLLASPAGSYEVKADYVAPDGVAADQVSVASPIVVLGADDSRCWETSTVVEPTEPTEPTTPPEPTTPTEPTKPTETTPTKTVTELAETGAEGGAALPLTAAATALAGAALLGASVIRRRFAH